MTGVKFNINIDDSTKLRDLIELELHKYEEEVKSLVEKSIQEEKIEKALVDLEKVSDDLVENIDRTGGSRLCCEACQNFSG